MSGKRAPILKVNDFEETCMWMSYRYAIGRHSIASVMHANDIAQNLFYRLPNDRKEFTAFDIAREIDYQLKNDFLFYVDTASIQENTNYYPLEAFIGFLEKTGINDFRKLEEFYRVEWDGKKYKSGKHRPNEDYIGHQRRDTNLDDLLPWQRLAACFDVHRLKVVKTLYQGEEKEYICFKTYFKRYGKKIEKDLQGNDMEINDLHNIKYVEHWMDLNSYLGGHENRYISDSFIVDIRDITDEECKQFEAYV